MSIGEVRPASVPTRKQLVASINSGYRNAEWFNAHGCPGQAALIYERIRVWEDRLEKGDHR